jgi:hypothetical protein
MRDGRGTGIMLTALALLGSILLTALLAPRVCSCLNSGSAIRHWDVFYLTRLYNMLYSNIAVTPYKSTTYSVSNAFSMNCPASPLQYMEICGGGGGGIPWCATEKQAKQAQAN